MGNERFVAACSPFLWFSASYNELMRAKVREEEHKASRAAPDDALLAEQFRSLSSLIPTMYLVLVSNSLFLEFVTATERWALRSYPISGILAVVSALRIFFWFRGRRRLRTIDQIRFTFRITLVTAFGISVGLAIWSIYVLDTVETGLQSYVPLFTALSTITCAACLTGLPMAAYIVFGAGTVPIAAALLLSGNPPLIAAGSNLMIIAMLMIGLVRRQFLQLRNMVAAHTETREEKRRAAELAYSDPLTGLPNRRSFLKALEELDAVPSGPRVAAAMLDLDGFKAINDSLGHVAGDGLLAAVAERLSGLLRPGDMLARLGGDEFALLMREVDTLSVARERLRPMAEAFEQPFLVDGKNLVVRSSIGVAHGRGNEFALVELLHRADLALYDAKAVAGSSLSAFEDDMAERIRRQMLIEQAASDDLALAGLTVHFQPIVKTADMRFDGFEALARWRHPELGEIQPGEFIGVAERRGLTPRLTAILFRQAVAEASTWPPHLRLSFNLSSVELASPGVCDRIFGLCEEYAFPLHRLSIEVTETALLNDFDTARSVIERFRSEGVHVLLDDFGAGFASIGYLRQIQFDEIKLDGSLIGSITESAIARDLLVGVLHLCRAIGTPVTAEMVETHEHLDLLRTLGVDKVQGYLFGEPARKAQIDKTGAHLLRAAG